jgi:hypothetical protein
MDFRKALHIVSGESAAAFSFEHYSDNGLLANSRRLTEPIDKVIWAGVGLPDQLTISWAVVLGRLFEVDAVAGAGGGDTSLPNLTLLCTYHHRLLHEGAFKAYREADGTLRFERPDGRTILRCGYRLVDFEDDFEDDDENPSREGFRTKSVQNPSAEVREPAAVYRIRARAG